MSQYAQLSDLTTYAINPIALTQIPVPAQIQSLIAASERIDSYIAGRYQLPLLPPYPISLVVQCTYIAAYMLMSVRGYRPEQGSDMTIRKNFDDAIRWCMDVQRQSVHPAVVESTPPAGEFDLPRVISGTPRGWGRAGVGS